MKIKMKLFLLCAAVAPFLMMTSSQQNGSRFGCVCALEKGNSNDPNENADPAHAPELFDMVPHADLWDMVNQKADLWELVNQDADLWDRFFNQNKEILKQYASDNNTLDYYYFERIVELLAEDKGDSIKSFKNQPERKAVDWLDFCFLSAVLEGLFAARKQKCDSMEHTFRKEFPKAFPFAELKKLTCSMWTQLKSNGLELSNFYRGLINLMHCRESEFFNLISCLADVQSPYMQLFFVCLMNFAYSRNTDVDWYNLINILYKFPDSFDDEDVVKSILSCFHFDSKVKQTLLNYYSSFLMKKDAYYVLSKLAYLSGLNFIED